MMWMSSGYRTQSFVVVWAGLQIAEQTVLLRNSECLLSFIEDYIILFNFMYFNIMLFQFELILYLY